MTYQDVQEDPSWLKAQVRAEQAALRKVEAADRRQGIRSHAIDPTDPWSAIERRACLPGCPQHRSAS